MKLRPLTAVALVLVLLQYLAFSESAHAFAIPELGIFMLILGHRYLNFAELLSLALLLGYFSEIIGAVEQGSLLIAYLITAIGLNNLERIDLSSRLLDNLSSLVGGLILFHGSLAIIASPVLWREWIAVVTAQIIVGGMLMIVNIWMQRVWQPRA